MDAISRRVRADGLEIAVTDVGVGVPVVCMHGNPDNRRSWDPMIEALEGKVRIIAPDFPGFGDSPEPPTDFDFLPATLASLWEDFAVQIGLEEPAIVVVHDFGAPWLLPWLVAHPHRVRGLVLMNTCFDRAAPWHPLARLWQTPLLGELSWLFAFGFVQRAEMRRADPSLPAEYLERAHGHLLPETRRTILRTYRAWKDMAGVLDGWDSKFRASLSQIDARVLWGDQDPYLDGHWAELPDAEVTHLPDVGHWVYISRPDVVARAIEDVASRPARPAAATPAQ